MATCGVEERTSPRAVFSDLTLSSMNLGSLIVVFFFFLIVFIFKSSQILD